MVVLDPQLIIMPFIRVLPLVTCQMVGSEDEVIDPREFILPNQLGDTFDGCSSVFEKCVLAVDELAEHIWMWSNAAEELTGCLFIPCSYDDVDIAIGVASKSFSHRSTDTAGTANENRDSSVGGGETVRGIVRFSVTERGHGLERDEG